MKNSIIFFTFLLSLLFIGVVAAEPFTKTMEEGEEQTFIIGGKSYLIEVIIIEDATPANVYLKINGEITSQLPEQNQYVLKDGTMIEIKEIWLNEAGEAGSGDLVTFAVYYCGDTICGTSENCLHCVADCGCQEGYYCREMMQPACLEIECGDSFCSPGETCEKDSCCNGEIFDLPYDRANCGTCGNVCKRLETCNNGVCQGKGQQVVQQKQTTKTFKKPVIEQDKCSSATDCDDKNPCTLDSCEGKPRKCVAQKQQGCILGTMCVAQHEIIQQDQLSFFCGVQNVLEPQKEEGKACLESYECLSGQCKEGSCYVKRPTFIETILNWFGIDIKEDA